MITLQNVAGGDWRDGNTVSFSIPPGTLSYLIAVGGPNADLTQYGMRLVSKDRERSVWRGDLATGKAGESRDA